MAYRLKVLRLWLDILRCKIGLFYNRFILKALQLALAVVKKCEGERSDDV